MYLQRIAISLAILLGLGAGAYAVQTAWLAGGPVYGGPGSINGTINCRVFNAGTTSINMSQRQIFTNIGTSVTLTGDTCNVPLPGGKSCVFSALIAGNLAFSCRAHAAGATASLRGAAEIQASDHSILNSAPLLSSLIQ